MAEGIQPPFDDPFRNGTAGHIPDDDEATLVYRDDLSSLGKLSPEEMRRRLDLPADGERIVDYGTLRTIGIGGIGAVFSAREPGLNRGVALKILRPEFRRNRERIEGFIREARLTAQIDHPNIVPVYRLGVFDEVGVFFSMKQVRGETLRMILKNLTENRAGYRRKYTLPRLLEIFIGACNGVAFAHQHGILHCDLKPANLMVGDYGEVMVMDWGMATYYPDYDRSPRKLDLDRGIAAPPRDVRPGGTPAFMAPECFSPDPPPPSIRSDIYSLGAILYAILTWRTAPFNVEVPPEELAAAVCGGRCVPPHRIPPPGRGPVPRELEAICLKAMARRSEERYESVDELLGDLRNYIDGYPVAAYSPPPFYRVAKFLNRKPMIPAVFMAALIGAFSFFSMVQMNRYSENWALLNLAEYNFRRGRQIETSIRSDLRRRAVLPAESEADPEIESRRKIEFMRRHARMNDSYETALELISRMSDDSGSRWKLSRRLAGDIFRNVLTLSLENGDSSQLLESLDRFRARNGRLLARAAESNPALGELVRRIDSGMGSVEIVSGAAAADWQMAIVPDRGDRDEEEEPTAAAVEFPKECVCCGGVHTFRHGARRISLPLAAGDYFLCFRHRFGATLRFPLRVRVAGTVRFFFTPPRRLRPGYVLIPRSETLNPAGGEAVLPACFLIGRSEVTVGEYLEFWNSLPPGELRENCRAFYRPEGNISRITPVWDDAGRLAPGFSPELPVTGISADAAEAYCRWLGARWGEVVRLPTRREWEIAALGGRSAVYPWGSEYRKGVALLVDAPRRQRYPHGAPAGSFPEDRSGFGVGDMGGNVREWLVCGSAEPGIRPLAGGSFRTPARFARIGSRQYRVGGAAGNDVGFRCLIELPRQTQLPELSSPEER